MSWSPARAWAALAAMTVLPLWLVAGCDDVVRVIGAAPDGAVRDDAGEGDTIAAADSGGGQKKLDASFPDQGASVSETITCIFKNTASEQTCSSSLGSCKGIGSCVVTVTAAKGKQLVWSSSCGGSGTTTVDGIDEKATFDCGVGALTETVKCSFKAATKEHTCTSVKGSCKGIGFCSVKISGNKGEQVSWTSTCGGAGQSTIDGVDEIVAFNCP